MPTIDRDSGTRARTTLSRATLASLLILAAELLGCGRAPSMGPDREVFHTVDALYTGVSLRDLNQVDRCAKNLEALGSAGKLPSPAVDALARIIEVARSGDWERSQSALRKFMLAQRR